MKKAGPAHKALVVDILASSFHDNLSVNYIVKQDNNKASRIRSLMAYSFDTCLLSGEVFLSEDETACVLVMYPDKKKTSLASVVLDIKLVWQVIGLGNLRKVMAREAVIKQTRYKEIMTYLWFIGVRPGHQQKGTGRRLLQEIIQYSDAQKRSVYLETSMPKNLPWYKQAGFEIYAEKYPGYRLYFLRRAWQ